MVGCTLFKLCHYKCVNAYLLEILGMPRLWHDLMAHGPKEAEDKLDTSSTCPLDNLKIAPNLSVVNALTLVLLRGVTTTPNSFRPGAQNRTAKG